MEAEEKPNEKCWKINASKFIYWTRLEWFFYVWLLFTTPYTPIYGLNNKEELSHTHQGTLRALSLSLSLSLARKQVNI